MKARTRATLAACALLLGLAHPASADPPNDAKHAGSCSFDSVSQVSVTGPDQHAGVVYGFAVAYSPTPAHNPVTMVRMQCELFVDGVLATSVDARTAGPVGVLEPTPIRYTARVDQILELCTETETVDAHGQTASYLDCPHATHPIIPPDGFVEFVDSVFEAVNPVSDALIAAEVAYVDPVVCPVLVSLAPRDVPGLLRIEPDGDLYVADTLIWDCPPYSS
jgi:hypothetical protein